jgi:hypothetical protein
MTTDLIADTYISLWNEPDAERRRALIARLWTEDAEHALDPPADVRAAATRVGFENPALVVRGHDELEGRVTRAYEEFIAPGEHAFRVAPAGALRVGEAVKFAWQMVAVADGTVAGGGTDVLLLAPDGRIRRDYQFIDR